MRNLKKQHNLSTFFVQSIDIDPKTYGLNYQKLGKELMSQDEISVMDGGKCILQVRGARPFFSDKFDITKHPRYKFLSDFDKKMNLTLKNI